ncbi:hypothetical protein D3C81_1786550 [compost metagenome]
MHCQVASDVAMAGVARTFQRDGRLQIGTGHQRGDGGLEEFGEALFLCCEHGVVSDGTRPNIELE